MVCSSVTCSIPNAEKIEFNVISQYKPMKIKTIKDMENEARQIKERKDEQKRIELENLKRQQEDEIKRKEQEERMRNKREFILTYYTSMNDENGFGAITCNGEELRDGIVANNVLDLGTKIKLEGYGEVVVADRGGSSFNSDTRLDVYIPRENNESNYEYSKRVNNMGKVRVTGYILNK
jgi:3D (Asp-Asp-Asp) domain-containing protein